MVNTEAIRTGVGILGNIISFGLFLSPSPTFWKIWKANSVQEFKSDPYVMTLLNCAMWVFYGLPIIKPDTILVLSINAVGFAIEAIYIALFFYFANWQKRRRIIIPLALEAVFFAVVVVITFTCLHGDKRAMVVGIICIVLNILMYLSPLTIMTLVIRTKSVKYMPFWLSVANFFNGLAWLCYALLKFDLNVVIPNGIGAVSGLAQLALYAAFYRTTNWDDDDADGKPSEVQLSDNIARV